LLSKGAKAPATEQIALIFRNQDHPYAVMVDDILRQQQVVVKQLGVELKNSKGFSGSAILGDGRPALIIEMLELVGSLKAQGRSAA
jgi:two-component system chemotaxis sensor kinase CheA